MMQIDEKLDLLEQNLLIRYGAARQVVNILAIIKNTNGTAAISDSLVRVKHLLLYGEEL